MDVWLQFLLTTLLILFAGSRLAKYGDCIAEKTGLGGTWIGIVLLSSITSLPELMTGISSVAIFDVPDIAVGDVIGSCMFNVLIIGLLDGMAGKEPFSRMVHQGHTLVAGFVIVCLGLALIDLEAPRGFLSLGWIDVFSLIYLATYLIAMRTIFIHEKNRLAQFMTELDDQTDYEHVSLRFAISMFILNALLIITCASFLPLIADKITGVTGLGHTFVGSIFVALSTSLPEIVVSISAVRVGSFDMAIASLLGSNIFNVAVLAIDDLFYVKGPLLEHASENYVITASAAMIMTAIIIVGLTFRAEKKPLRLSWEALSILAVYSIGTYFLYIMS